MCRDEEPEAVMRCLEVAATLKMSAGEASGMLCVCRYCLDYSC
jgi:hypothetical protein